jgi:hypothetical protein
MKKATLYLLMLTLFSWVAVSCSKSEGEAPQTDPRDAWVGNYSEVINGSITVNIPGAPMTLPFSDTGSFRIEKGSATNRIIRVDGDTLQTGGTINGNQVTFDAVTETVVETGMTMTMTATATGTLSGSTLTSTTNLNGTASMSGLTLPVTGSATSVATKK